LIAKEFGEMSLLGDFKEVADLLKKAGNIDLYEKILALREQILEISSENLECKQRIRELEEGLRQQHEMEFRGQFYYKAGDDVPYCPTCWETKRIAVHLAVGEVFNICQHCKSSFNAAAEEVARRSRIRGPGRYLR
jgi:hypothetical protein